MTKLQQMQDLLVDLRQDKSPQKINPPLINQFALHNRIPNRWFDWENRVNSKVMIIGQDWGPYLYLKKYIADPDKDHLSSSRTEKFIINTLNSFDPTLINTIFFTVAIMFTRTGNLFRGNQNFNERQSFDISFPYLSRQITIVQPKVILTLGGLAFQAVNQHFNLNLSNQKLKTTVEQGIITTSCNIIIPAYHPAGIYCPQDSASSMGTPKNSSPIW